MPFQKRLHLFLQILPHLAFGAAIRICLEGGEDMSPEEFARKGGNDSLTHVDFMVGSGKVDVDGVRADGSAEPVMRSGEWAFEVTPS